MQYQSPESIDLKKDSEETGKSENNRFLNTDQFVHYTGRSMYPTFHDPEFLVINQISKQDLKAGDIIVFRTPEMENLVIHRIVRIISGQYQTRGDNNKTVDKDLVSYEQIVGRAQGIVRKKNTVQKVSNGLGGLLRSKLLFVRITMKNDVLAPILWNPVTKKLRAVITRVFSIKPELVTFNNPDGSFRINIIWRNLVIGSYESRGQHLRVRIRYRLLINRDLLENQIEKILQHRNGAHK